LIKFLSAYFPSRTVILGVSEAALIALAFVCASVARLGATDASVMLSDEQGLLKIIVVASAFVLCMYYYDLYDSSVLSNRREMLTRVIQVVGTVCLLSAVIYYVYPPLELGRGIFLIGLSFVAVILLLCRKLFIAINRLPRLAERALLYGDGSLAALLASEVASRPELGLRIVSQVPILPNGDYGLDPETPNELLFRAVSIHRPSRIFVVLDDRRGKLPVEPLLKLKSHGVRIQDGTEVYEAITGKVPIESIRLGSLLFSPGFCISRFLLLYKRLASILISIAGLLVSLPLLPLIALAIKLTSPGTVFYEQERLGIEGKAFHCYKFRTMRADAEADSGPTWAGDEDPRITSLGRFLRICRLDEIPQLWNVLKGDMSLVGPRPERPEFVESLNHEIPYYHLRHTIRPGITGWAQICYKYGGSVDDAKEKLRYDLYYIKNMSPGLDVLILFRTVKTILLGLGAR